MKIVQPKLEEKVRTKLSKISELEVNLREVIDLAKTSAAKLDQQITFSQEKFLAMSESQKRDIGILENKFFAEKLPEEKAVHAQIASLIDLVANQTKEQKETNSKINEIVDNVNDLLDWQAKVPSVDELKDPRVSEKDPVRVQLNATTKHVQDMEIDNKKFEKVILDKMREFHTTA